MSQFISQLAENYPVSGIRRMFDLAAGKQDIINLCNGEPNFDTPENIKQAAIRSIEANQTRYAPEAGLPAFRKAVAEKYTKQFGRPFTEQNVMASAGGVEGIILSFMTVLNPGDEVIIPDPAYTCYQGQAELLGAKVVRVPLKEEHGFRLQPEDLEAVITPKTKVVLLNHTLVVNSLSKTYAMTGWRVGYVVSSNLEIMTKMVKMQQALIPCLPGFVMAGAAEALSGSQDSVKYMSGQYARRRCETSPLECHIDRTEYIRSCSSGIRPRAADVRIKHGPCIRRCGNLRSSCNQ